MKTSLILFTCLIFMNVSLAQISPGNLDQKKIAIDGQIGLTTDGHALFVNMGGPGTKFSFKKFAVSVNMFPSVFFKQRTIEVNNGYSITTKKELMIRPSLGVGPQVFVNRFIFEFPCYYIFNNNVWTFTAGVGYKILVF